MEDSTERHAGQPGVPTGDQYPSNDGEGDGMNEEIVADVNIPGAYPSDRGDPTGEPLTPGPEPTKATRGTGSLGNLTENVSNETTRDETGGLGSPAYDDQKSAGK